ncbi:ATP-dependent DNA helicase [Aquipuribacter sp. SD81]|uniref:ATP-dependent DNA helicase n=1 Tax=Aquipuribacter sp. SD81 TaxID=3127703 RepID=UPI003019355A
MTEPAAAPPEGGAAEPATAAADLADEAAGLLATVVAATGGTPRAGQEQMARAVAEAVTEHRHLLVQAGTGTGKSWGYLVPVVAAAVRRGERVVVATSTLALQGQLVRHDLPRLADALEGPLGRRPTWQLVKGRNNYVCRHRLDGGDAEEDDALSLWGADDGSAGPRSGLELQVARAREWAETTTTGDRDELVPGVSDRAWRAVSVTARECLGAQRCPAAAECFSEDARARAREVDVVVTNHALLTIDAVEGLQTLPPHDVVVVDEAHDLVDRVTTTLSRDLTATAVRTAAGAARRSGADASQVRDLERAADGLERALADVTPGRLPDGPSATVQDALLLVSTAARGTLRSLPRDQPAGEDAGAARSQAGRAALLEVVGTAERLAGVPRPDRDDTAGPAAGGGTAGEGETDDEDAVEAEAEAEAEAPAEAPTGTDVVWLDDDERRGHVLVAAPLSVAGLLRSRLLDTRTVVATSATLVGPGGFDALARRLGLGRGGWTGLDVGSPFDYRRQAILYVAAHLPPPGRDGHGEPLWDELVALVEAAGGRTLGLFSSRRAAERAAEVVRARTDLPVLCQGDDAVPTLVRQFADDEPTCLFGTLGLWQGVDVPGPSCSLVVLDRVPFPRPDDPLAQARTEAVAAGGGNGFMTVSVAHAATLLAQGAGRLVRSTADRGVVAVLDQRVVTRRYGDALLQALPPMWRTTDRATVLAALERLRATAGSAGDARAATG